MIRRAAQVAARETWSTQLGFLVAAIGSAIGLGNIWRFPGVAYANGGGAFLIPYLVALLTAGIPFLIFDYALGHRFQGSAPTVFRRIGGWFESLGWFQVAVSFVIMTYYAVVVAWSVSYIFFSAQGAWGSDPVSFFTKDYLQVNAPSFSLNVVSAVLFPLLAVWVIVLVFLGLGIQRGLERANKIFIPLLVVIFLVMVVRTLFLPGATDGINAFFTPNWAALLRPDVWVAAYSQIFYSLSVGFGIMITYASYLPRRVNIGPTALVAAFANSSFEIVAGIGVFSTLGFMAHEAGVGVQDIEGITGVSLSFMTFPKIISMMPGGHVFGILFFLSLTIAGITSLMSLIQVVSSAFQDKFGFSATRSALILGLVAMFCSVLFFSTTNGLNALDVVDNWINSVGILGIALLSVLYVTYGKRMLRELRLHINFHSSIRFGKWWIFVTGLLTPAILLYILLATVWSIITTGYGGYPHNFILMFGWGCVVIAFLLTAIFTLLPWYKKRAPQLVGYQPWESLTTLEALEKEGKL